MIAFLFVGIAVAEIIDRIVAVVGSQVVTESAMLRQMRVSALLAGKATDFSPAAKRTAIEQMAKQLLIRDEMESGHFPLPPMADVNKTLEAFRKEHYPDDAGWQRALEDYRLTQDDVRDQIQLQLTVARFISFRFSPAVSVSSSDIEDYYRKHAAQMGGQPLEDVRDTIEQVLREERVDEALDRWLSEMQNRTRIEIREEALK